MSPIQRNLCLAMSRKTTHPLKAFRENHDPPLSQIEAAKHFGVSQAAWSRYERGIDRPRKKIALKLIRETGVSVEVLMGIAS